MFELDTTSQPEEFSAVVHQMQKHALLYSRREDGPSAGEWRPLFLSDWIRNALLARVWLARKRLSAFVNEAKLLRHLGRAERAGLAFRELLGTLDDQDALAGLPHILVVEANGGSPEAAVNFWALSSALPTDRRHEIAVPSLVPPFAEFTGATFEGVTFEQQFSSSLVVFSDAVFINCSFIGCTFSDCEFVDASFEGCTFSNTTFSKCWGPARFEACGFDAASFIDARSLRGSAWIFDACRLNANTRVTQTNLVLENGFARACEFVDCESYEAPARVLTGDGLGFETTDVPGLVEAQEETSRPKKHQCLRGVLKAFFQSRAGPGGDRQARRYIRSSAIGRGAMPIGSPSQADLIQILESEGFTDGGRAAHLYAPWSSVVGAGAKAIALRNELNDYVRDNGQGAATTRMLDRICKLTGWE